MVVKVPSIISPVLGVPVYHWQLESPKERISQDCGGLRTCL